MKAEEVQTREEAYPFIDVANFRCAGKISPENLALLAEKRQAVDNLTTAGCPEDMDESQWAETIAELTGEADRFERSHRGIFEERASGPVYRPCNFDVGDIIKDGPLDGGTYGAECPRCGNFFTYTAAIFPAMSTAESQRFGEKYEFFLPNGEKIPRKEEAKP